MDIKPIYVTFEQAKLLKEKEFDIICSQCYAEERLIDKKTGGDLYTGIYRMCTKSRFHKRYYYAPEQHIVVEWLRVKHGIWVEIRYLDDVLNFGYIVTTIKNNTEQKEKYNYNSPQEAYSAAFDYILKEMI
jgi:hypothetical protein